MFFFAVVCFWARMSVSLSLPYIFYVAKIASNPWFLCLHHLSRLASSIAAFFPNYFIFIVCYGMCVNACMSTNMCVCVCVCLFVCFIIVNIYRNYRAGSKTWHCYLCDTSLQVWKIYNWGVIDSSSMDSETFWHQGKCCRVTFRYGEVKVNPGFWWRYKDAGYASSKECLPIRKSYRSETRSGEFQALKLKK